VADALCVQHGLPQESGCNKAYQEVYPEITGRLCAVYPLDLKISIVRLIGEHLAEHFGKALGLSVQESGFGKQAQLLSVNVVYTGPVVTIRALRAGNVLAQDLSATVHIRAMIPVPRQLAIKFAFTSVQSLKGLLRSLIERAGSKGCEYVLHIYLCRNRMETLLSVLRSSSLLVIGDRRRLWPTAKTGLSKAAISTRHSVAFVDLKAS
jgi:hypothetical protein